MEKTTLNRTHYDECVDDLHATFPPWDVEWEPSTDLERSRHSQENDASTAGSFPSRPSKTGSHVSSGTTARCSFDGSVVVAHGTSSPSPSEVSEDGESSGPPARRLPTKAALLCVVAAALLLFGAGITSGVVFGRRDGASSGGAVPITEHNSTGPADATGVTSSPTESDSEVPSPTVAPSGSPTVAPSGSPTGSPTVITADVARVPIPPPSGATVSPEVDLDGYNYTANSDYLVGVYYYPWHGDDFHNGEGYMRREIVPRQYPSLGEYDDSDPAVIAEHMRMFRRANIGLLVTSWWGPDRLEDSTTKDIIMVHEDVGNLKIALHYETFSRLGELSDNYAQAQSDIDYMCANYFDHPNYFKIDGRPVLVVYISRVLNNVGTLEQALLTMRSQAAKCGHNIYLIGDDVFASAPDPTVPHYPFWYFDAVTNYDIYGSAGRPEGYAGSEAVQKYYGDQAEWKKQAGFENCRYIPAVSPGYNDRGVRLENDHPALSRRLTEGAEEGSLFHFQLQRAKELADPDLGNIIFVNSFNEWHEDTQIEPVAVGGPAEWPPLMTQGLDYVGYGNLYLDILGASTASTVGGGGIFDYLYD